MIELEKQPEVKTSGDGYAYYDYELNEIIIANTSALLTDEQAVVVGCVPLGPL